MLGRKLPLAAGNTPISCSRGLNCKQSNQMADSQRSTSSPEQLLLCSSHWSVFSCSWSLKAAPQCRGQERLQVGTFTDVKVPTHGEMIVYHVCQKCVSSNPSCICSKGKKGHVLLKRGGHIRRAFHLTGLVPFSNSVNIPWMSLKSEANGA